MDHMGLVVALGGEQRFTEMAKLSASIKLLSVEQQVEVKETLRLRFTPTNGQDGCRSGTEAVNVITS